MKGSIRNIVDLAGLFSSCLGTPCTLNGLFQGAVREPKGDSA
jgi:hypothetical protein